MKCKQKLFSAKMLFVVLSAVSLHVHGRGISNVYSVRRFDDMIQSAPFAVVVLYNESDSTPVWQQRKNDRLEDALESVSRDRLYQDADVEFVMLNVADGKLQDVAKDFGVTQFPSVLLFKNGYAVERGSRPTQLSGYAGSSSLKGFINNHLRTAMHDYVDDQRPVYVRRPHRARYHYYGYPYARRRYRYYHRPRFGIHFGVGKHGGYKHRRHGYYGRRHYGGGISFSF